MTNNRPPDRLLRSLTPSWGVMVLLSVLGGAVGALIVEAGLPAGGTFDWGNFLGLAITAGVAGAVARSSLRDYHRRQERDEVSRRWVDEGFYRVGRAAGEDYERELTNWTVCHQLIQGVEAGMTQESLAMLLAQIDNKAPTLQFEHRRLIELFSDPRLVKSMGAFYGQLRAAHISFASVIPGLLASASSIPEEKREAFFAELREDFDKAIQRFDLVHPFLTGFARLAREFETLGCKSYAEVVQAPARLEPFIEELATVMKPAIDQPRAEGGDA